MLPPKDTLHQGNSNLKGETLKYCQKAKFQRNALKSQLSIFSKSPGRKILLVKNHAYARF